MSKVKGKGEQKAAKSERNEGDEGFVEDYIEHDHADEERRELSHPDNLSTSSRDDDKEVWAPAACPVMSIGAEHHCVLGQCASEPDALHDSLQVPCRVFSMLPASTCATSEHAKRLRRRLGRWGT